MESVSGADHLWNAIVYMGDAGTAVRVDNEDGEHESTSVAGRGGTEEPRGERTKEGFW